MVDIARPFDIVQPVYNTLYIWDTNGKQGFYYWNQNKLNMQKQNFTCIDTQLQIFYCITVPILFDLDFQICEPKWYIKLYQRHVFL